MKPNRALTERRLACENRQFFVYFDDLTYQGQEVHDYLVVAPKQVTGDLVTGVAVLPIIDGKFGLLKIYRHAVQNICWEIPRGFIEPGESEAVSALRELTEETGLVCDVSDIDSLGFVTPDAGVLAARVHLYAARRCRRGERMAPLEFGHQEFCLFSRTEMNGLITRSEIQDPCTLIAYYKYINL